MPSVSEVVLGYTRSTIIFRKPTERPFYIACLKFQSNSTLMLKHKHLLTSYEGFQSNDSEFTGDPLHILTELHTP